MGWVYVLGALLLAWGPSSFSAQISCPKSLVAKPRYVVVVDAFSSGNLLAPALKSWGFTPIHVQSSPKLPAVKLATLQLEDFDPRLRYVNEDDGRTLEGLRRLDVEFVIPGAEAGVLFADYLSEKLGVRTNGTALSLSRRDKYEMAERLRRAGIEAVKQFQSKDLNEILREAPKLGNIVVMKPLMSAGGDRIFFTKNEADRRQAFAQIMGEANIYGDPNQAVLVQEYLDGPEYMVDTMALDGEIIVTDAALYDKDGAIYKGARFVPYEEIQNFGVVEYLKAVHQALGIHFGPGHAEVKIVNRHGRPTPVLVEIGARMAGGGIPVLAKAACGRSQLDTWMETLADPEAFRRKIGVPYRVKPNIMLCLISKKTGILESLPYLARIQALPGFTRWKPRVHPGKNQVLPITTSFNDYPGHFEFVADTQAAIDDAIRRIREWEAMDDFFTLRK